MQRGGPTYGLIEEEDWRILEQDTSDGEPGRTRKTTVSVES
jgi:hypothetical protein